MSRRKRPQLDLNEPPPARVRGVAEMESVLVAHLRRIAEIERQICALQAEQVRETAAYVRDQLTVDEMLRIPAGEAQHRAMIAEIALARGTSTGSASRWLADAYDLDESLPYTLDALANGDITLWSARTISHQTGVLDDVALRRLADELIAEEAKDLLPGEVKKLAETRVIGIDPAAADARAERARADKQVSCVADEPGTAWLKALLPAEQAAACWEALHDHAIAAYAGGDPDRRPVGHLMCDSLVQRLTGQAAAGDVKTHVSVVMTDTTLLGLDDRPAQLLGIGPLPPATARLVAASGDTWVRRLFTDPVDGSVLLTDTRKRRYDGSLREQILSSDQRCRAPHCTTRIADVDHIHEYTRGGSTSRANGQGLSKGCHTMRDHPGVTAVRSEQHPNAVTWTLPSGATATTLPPPALRQALAPEASSQRDAVSPVLPVQLPAKVRPAGCIRRPSQRTCGQNPWVQNTWVQSRVGRRRNGPASRRQRGALAARCYRELVWSSPRLI